MRDRDEIPAQIDSKSNDHKTIFPVGKEGGIPNDNRGENVYRKKKE